MNRPSYSPVKDIEEFYYNEDDYNTKYSVNFTIIFSLLATISFGFFIKNYL